LKLFPLYPDFTLESAMYYYALAIHVKALVVVNVRNSTKKLAWLRVFEILFHPFLEALLLRRTEPTHRSSHYVLVHSMWQLLFEMARLLIYWGVRPGDADRVWMGNRRGGNSNEVIVVPYNIVGTQRAAALMKVEKRASILMSLLQRGLLLLVFVLFFLLPSISFNPLPTVCS
jgi:hypothetical protein